MLADMSVKHEDGRPVATTHSPHPLRDRFLVASNQDFVGPQTWASCPKNEVSIRRPDHQSFNSYKPSLRWAAAQKQCEDRDAEATDSRLSTETF
jgi:hypothetical protein